MDSDISQCLCYLTHQNSLSFGNVDRQSINDVFSIVEYEAKKKFGDIHKSDDAINEKLCIVKENLFHIIDCLKLCEEKKKTFIRKYPKWRELRMKNITSLYAMGISLNEDRKNCNISRLVGSCVSVVGGGLCAAGVVMAPFSFGLTTPIAIAGGTMIGLGSATSIGTSVTEISIMKQKIQEANKLVAADKEAFEELRDWFEISNDLSKAMDCISNIDVGKRILNTMTCFIQNSFTFKNHAERIQHVRSMVQSTLDYLKESISAAALLISRLLGLFFIVSLLNYYKSQLFNNISKTVASIVNFASLVGVSGDAILMASNVIKSSVKIGSDIGKTVAKGAVAVIGISLDIASITLTSIDIHNGSQSQEGQKIMELAKNLEDEADILEKLFSELNNRS